MTAATSQLSSLDLNQLPFNVINTSSLPSPTSLTTLRLTCCNLLCAMDLQPLLRLTTRVKALEMSAAAFTEPPAGIGRVLPDLAKALHPLEVLETQDMPPPRVICHAVRTCLAACMHTVCRDTLQPEPSLSLNTCSLLGASFAHKYSTLAKLAHTSIYQC